MIAPTPAQRWAAPPGARSVDTTGRSARTPALVSEPCIGEVEAVGLIGCRPAQALQSGPAFENPDTMPRPVVVNVCVSKVELVALFDPTTEPPPSFHLPWFLSSQTATTGSYSSNGRRGSKTPTMQTLPSPQGRADSLPWFVPLTQTAVSAGNTAAQTAGMLSPAQETLPGPAWTWRAGHASTNNPIRLVRSA